MSYKKNRGRVSYHYNNNNNDNIYNNKINFIQYDDNKYNKRHKDKDIISKYYKENQGASV